MANTDKPAMPTWQEFRKREPNYSQLDAKQKIALRATYEDLYVEAAKKIAERDARAVLEEMRATDLERSEARPDPDQERRERYAEQQEIARVERLSLREDVDGPSSDRPCLPIVTPDP